jgi:hypothetical protein
MLLLALLLLLLLLLASVGVGATVLVATPGCRPSDASPGLPARLVPLLALPLVGEVSSSARLGAAAAPACPLSAPPLALVKLTSSCMLPAGTCRQRCAAPAACCCPCDPRACGGSRPRSANARGSSRAVKPCCSRL